MSLENAFNANMTPAEARVILDKTIGDILEGFGFLKSEQLDHSGRVQGRMLAIRNAVKAGTVSLENVQDAVGSSGNNPINFINLVFKSEEEQQTTLTELGISQEDTDTAIAEVETAKQDGRNISFDKDYFITPMGTIHEKLHGRKIHKFDTVKQAALIAQRTTDAANAMKAIKAEDYDAFTGQKRGFKTDFGDETPELIAAIELSEAINGIKDSHGNTQQITNHHLHGLQLGYEAAVKFFRDAGAEPQAAIIGRVAWSFLGEYTGLKNTARPDVPTKAIRTPKDP